MTANEKGGTDRQDKKEEQATQEATVEKTMDSAAKETEATANKVTPTIHQDLFDNIHRLRAGSNFSERSNPQKVLVSVPVRKPEPQEFFRVQPSEEYQFDTYTVEVKTKKEHYLIEPHLIPYLPSDAKPKLILTCINAQGVVFLYPLPLGLSALPVPLFSATDFSAGGLCGEGALKKSFSARLERWSQVCSSRVPSTQWPPGAFLQHSSYVSSKTFLQRAFFSSWVSTRISSKTGSISAGNAAPFARPEPNTHTLIWKRTSNLPELFFM
jgi:hypothetical protein